MKLDYLREKGELVSVVLLGISAFLAVLVLSKVTGFFVAPAKAKSVVEKAVAQSKLDVNVVDKYLAESKAIADKLKEKNLFAPLPPRQHPVKEVWGILGDEVLIEDKWYKAGDMVADAKILAIEATQVKIEWDGNEKYFAPIDARAPAGRPASGPGAQVVKAEQAGGEGAEMVQVQPGEPPMLGGPPRGGFGGLSPEERAEMREQIMGRRQRFESMSPEERAEMRERFMMMRERFESMSPEEREEARAQMRERFGGRRRQ